MRRRRLGRSNVEVSAIAMGCWALAGDTTWGPQDKADSLATIRAALDAGITFFDTAEGYGEGLSEELLGEALAGHRYEVVIGTKVSPQHLHRDTLKVACEASLRRLRTDYIDVYFIHWPNWQVPFAETIQALLELKQEGKVRVVACSNFGVQDLTALLGEGRVEANQLCYSLLWRAIEFEVQALCAEEDISITCYSPLAQGLLTGKFRSPQEVPEGRARTRLFSSSRPLSRHGEPGAEQETFAALRAITEICSSYRLEMSHAALAWLTEQPAVASVIVGARTPGQARANAQAGDLKLAPEVVRSLSEATECLRTKMGPNPDMWQGESRIR